MKPQFNLKAATLVVSFALGVSGMTAVAYAGVDNVNENPSQKEFNALDKDNDGTLTRSEAAGDKFYTRKHFSAANLDNDGTLDYQEYSDYKSQEQQKNVGRVASDTTITTKVKANLVKEEGFKGLHVSVKTYKGVVQLSGFVESETQIARAEEIAKSVEGVKSVKNGLTVKS
jgi:hyperosmotically inducible periplasmic protein